MTFSQFIIQFNGAVEMGLIYGLVAIGVYLSFRVLDFPDLTVDGSFPLGAAVSAAMIMSGYDPVVSTLTAMLAGFTAGMVTAWMSTHLRMLNLLAGILTSSALYSINIRVMDKRPNISLLGEDTIFSQYFGAIPMWAALAILMVVFSAIIVWFLTTKVGLAVRATGNNPKMARAQGINYRSMTLLGVSMSNALVAFAGAMFAQKMGFADVTIGVGTIIIGLAALIVGEALVSTRTVLTCVIGCIIGAIVYRVAIAFALNASDIGLTASDVNLVTAILVVLALVLPRLKAARSAS